MTLTIKRKPALTAALTERSRLRREKMNKLAAVEARSTAARNDLLPNLQVEYRKIDEVHPAPRQVRKITAAHKAEVREAIRHFGFVLPLLVDGNGEIIDGHARLAVARDLGLDSVPVISVEHLTPTEIKTLRLTVNRLAEKGEWDLDELRLEFAEIIDLGGPIEVSGFEIAEIDQILGSADDPTDSEADQIPQRDSIGPSTSRPGDLWLLGPHRLLCGDARDPASYAKLMEGQHARLLLTDPPYNVPISGHVSGLGKVKHREFAMASGEMSDSQFQAFLTEVLAAGTHLLTEGGLVMPFIDWRGLSVLSTAATAIGLNQINLVVWSKTNAGMGSLYRSQHELLPVFKKGDASYVNNVELGRFGRWRSNLWTYPGASSLGSDARDGLALHPTVKPVAMLADAIYDVSNLGEIILDPFLGSGSTLIAAETTRRVCCGLEIDPAYVDVILARWTKFRGHLPVLADTGQTFDEIRMDRMQTEAPAQGGVTLKKGG